MKNFKAQIKNKFKFLSLVFIFLFLVFNSTQATTLYLMPSSQTIYQGETFIAEVRLNTEGEEINVVKADLEFPANLLEALDLSKGGSILTLWPEEPTFSSKEGSIALTGGLPGGFLGDGLILKITFLAKEIGQTNVNLKEDSQVLLNDGKGTPAILTLLEGSYEIVERPENLAKIFSNTHPDQNKWSKQSTLHLHWDLADGVQYSYLLSKDPLAEPDDIPDRPEGELKWIGDMEYPNLEDGIYYFSLKQKLPDENWSPKMTFRAMVDATPPEPFKLEIGQDPTVFEGKYFLSFYTTDKTSGIDYFEIKEGKRASKIISSPYVLEDQTLQSKITVKAIDKAGNERISQILPPEKPFPYSAAILILVAIIIILGTALLLTKKTKIPQTK